MKLGANLHFPPTWLDVAQFLDAFWPELAATFVGVMLGVPAALWLQRRAEGAAAARREVADTNRRGAIATILRDSIGWNRTVLGAGIAAMSVPSLHDWELDNTGWPVVRDEVVSLVTDPGDRALIAAWFGGLDQLMRTIDLLAQIHPGSQQAGLLRRLTAARAQHLERTIPMVDDVLTRLGGTVPSDDPNRYGNRPPVTS